MKENSSNLLDDLKNAIKNLEAFANQNESELIPHIQELDLQENVLISSPHSTLEKTIDLITSIFPEIKLKHDEKRIQIKKRLLESVAFLRNHYQIIYSLKKGSSEQKELATWALDTISRYNRLLNKAEEKPSLKNRVIHFIYEKSGLGIDNELKEQKIHLPHEFSVYFSTAKNEETIPAGEDTKEKIALIFKNKDITLHQPTDQEKEMFLMKTIILAKTLQLPAKLMSELTCMMRNVPIETEVSNAEDQEAGTSIVSLEKTISLLPWEVTTVKGSFKRDSKSMVPSEPIKDSFEASTTAVQTAFPHPSQHTGFALSNTLIPECLHLLDTTSLFQEVLERKKQIAAALLPEGELNEKAKLIWNLKHQAFEGKKEIYIQLHHQFILAVVNSCPYALLDSHRIFPIIEHYFQAMKTHASLFELLSQTYHLINVFFIERPYNYMVQEWLQVENKNEDPKTRYNQAIELLNRKMNESVVELTEEIQKSDSSLAKIIEEYILHVGYLLGQGCRAILLQKSSEKMRFAPPLLSGFDHKLHISVFRELIAFHEELNLELSEIQEEAIAQLQNRLDDELLSEIRLFENSEIPQDQSERITLELEQYFNERFFHSN